ncbi:MAG: hypothetical protein Q7S27_06255 [Nanoarchaeota archaeon]|nr:hypothetical protein [Nanoarchaeota archaeon]
MEDNTLGRLDCWHYDLVTHNYTELIANDLTGKILTELIIRKDIMPEVTSIIERLFSVFRAHQVSRDYFSDRFSNLEMVLAGQTPSNILIAKEFPEEDKEGVERLRQVIKPMRNFVDLVKVKSEYDCRELNDEEINLCFKTIFKSYSQLEDYTKNMTCLQLKRFESDDSHSMIDKDDSSFYIPILKKYLPKASAIVFKKLY